MAVFQIILKTKNPSLPRGRLVSKIYFV